MEVVAEEQGPLEGNKELGLEDTRDEEFDFDIDGPVDGLESIDDGVAYDTETNDAFPDTRTYSAQDPVAQEVLHESYAEQATGQEQGQNDLEVSAFDTSADAEVVVQADQFDDEQEVNAEREETQQADDAQNGEVDQYQEDDYVEVTAEEVRDFVDDDQHNEGQAQDTTVATAHAEFVHLEDEHYHDDLHEEGISAEEIGLIQSGDETQPPVDSSYADEVVENGTTVAEPHGEEAPQGTSLEGDPFLADTAAHQDNTSSAYDLDDASSQEEESFKGSEQHPRVRVSYGTAEFYLFAESPNADPDDYFFESADVLSQPLSQFLTKVRQVIAEDLQDLDELYVKVDGLGLEFGETTTNDFLEHTTFGQALELYDRLVKLDDDSSEVPELYIYLETKPNCLRRLTELSNNARNGKGLSEVGFYYEGTPDLTAIEDASNEHDEGRQGVDSDDISDYESNDQVGGGLSETHEAEQQYNPFRLSESQQQAMDASNSKLAGEEVADDPMSADHPAYEVENDEALLDEVQTDLELAEPPVQPDASAAEAQQDPDVLPGEDEDLAADITNGIEDKRYAGEDAHLGDEAAATQANAEAEYEAFQDDDGPTDGEKFSSLKLSRCTASSEICACESCMSAEPISFGAGSQAHFAFESEVETRGPRRQLVEEALANVQQALVATADWSRSLSPSVSARDSLAANCDHSNHIENTPADFSMQDYDTAEHDDYLDIEATEEQPTEPAEYAASAGTPEPTSHDSSATATLDGEVQGHGDDTSATEALADPGRSFETPLQAESGPPETQTDEIHWNDEDEDEYDNDSDGIAITDQNQTDLSPSSISTKRGRQADEDDVGPGDDSSKPLCGLGSQMPANIAPVAKRRRT